MHSGQHILNQHQTDHKNQQLTHRFKLQETRTLMINKAASLLPDAQRIFTDLSISIGTSIPDDIQIQDESVFVRYPSVQAAISVYEHLHGEIQLGGRKNNIQYYPIRKIDLNVAYDWYCQKCDYKNFARRGKCYRCQADKAKTCKLSYSTQPTTRPFKEESAENCSLMIRGSILCDIEQSVLLELFESIVPVRDVRQIRNKLTGKFKDFAFIEFFTPEETTIAFKEANEGCFRISGQKIMVNYSRNKSDDDFLKPLPYENNKRQRKIKDRPQQQDNYYHRQRQKQIQQEKSRPSITMEQLKEKHEQQMKKNQSTPRQMSEQQRQRRKAEMLARKWERDMKTQTIIYVCPVCCRKFYNSQQMKVHQQESKLHAFNLARLDNFKLII